MHVYAKLSKVGCNNDVHSRTEDIAREDNGETNV